MTNTNDFSYVQAVIGYDFDDERLLRQAFTRKSYAQEHNGTHHNEVLEFYGDKVLDFVVMRDLADHYGRITGNGKYASELNEGQLTEVKKNLVCKAMLAKRIDALGFKDLLLMGKGDIQNNAQDEASVKEDLFEAFLGAVAIDSGWDVETIIDVTERMLPIELYLDGNIDDSENYVDLIQQWCQKTYGDLPNYEIEEYDDGFRCQLDLSDDIDRYFYGEGNSKQEARMDAAESAYQYLDENGLLRDMEDEVGEPDRERAINQLQELAQKGFIAMPDYDFQQTYDFGTGAPIWVCDCYLVNAPYHRYSYRSSSRKNAKKAAAYAMLLDVLGYEQEDDD